MVEILYNTSLHSSCSVVSHSEFKKKVSIDAYLSDNDAHAILQEGVGEHPDHKEKTKDNVHTRK